MNNFFKYTTWILLVLIDLSLINGYPTHKSREQLQVEKIEMVSKEILKRLEETQKNNRPPSVYQLPAKRTSDLHTNNGEGLTEDMYDELLRNVRKLKDIMSQKKNEKLTEVQRENHTPKKSVLTKRKDSRYDPPPAGLHDSPVLTRDHENVVQNFLEDENIFNNLLKSRNTINRDDNSVTNTINRDDNRIVKTNSQNDRQWNANDIETMLAQLDNKNENKISQENERREPSPVTLIDTKTLLKLIENLKSILNMKRGGQINDPPPGLH